MDVDDVLDKLYNVVDPELGINIVDLGLIYNVVFENKTVVIDATLTSAACPFSVEIEKQVYEQFAGGEFSVKINWVFMPPWSVSKLTDEGKQMLTSAGFTVR